MPSWIRASHRTPARARRPRPARARPPPPPRAPLTTPPGTATPDPTTPPEETPEPTPTPDPSIDRDGDGYAPADGDCDDTDPQLHPDAIEVPYDGIDQDCDGFDADDLDGDGFVAEAAGGPDCNDLLEDVRPGAIEICDGIDNDCDDLTDESGALRFRDADADGYGDSSNSLQGCGTIPGYVAVAGDCNDAVAAINPGMAEVCNGFDDDCDGDVDEGVRGTWYADLDRDGYGAPAAPLTACTAPAGYVDNATDCNDGAASIHPGAAETCNGLDEDCDGAIDEGVGSPWYQDRDADGYGDPTVSTVACSQPAGYAANNTDCRDTNDTVHPGALEACDGLDNDCDGGIDEGMGTVYYRDADGDGYGSSTSTTTACGGAPSGYVANSSDCDDADSQVHPGGTETSNGKDDDCDGLVDFPKDCKEVKSLFPSASSGVFTVDQDGTGPKVPLSVYCELGLQGGGWTLVAVITNADDGHWSPTSTSWTDGGTFGTPTSPSTNADAKSRAWRDMTFDEVMVVKYPSSIEVVSAAGCLGGRSYQNLFRRNSSSSDNCAWSCDTAVINTPWKGDGCQDSKLKFRCMDNDGSLTVDGYKISDSDNSFITTLENKYCEDETFGLGSSDFAWDDVSDFSAYVSDSANNSDKTQRLLYGR